MNIPENVKTTLCKNGGISKTLLTPCRRLGLSRRIKITPDQNQSSQYASVSVSKKQETSVDTPPAMKKSKPSAKLLHKRNSVSSSKANIQFRFEKDDPSSCSSDNLKNNKNTQLASDLNNIDESSKSKVLQKQNKLDTSDTQACITPDTDIQTVVYIHPQLHSAQEEPCSKLEFISKQNIGNATQKNATSKTKLSKRLSMKKELSQSQDDLTDMESSIDVKETSVPTIFSNEVIDNNITIAKVDTESDKQVNFVSKKSSKKKRKIVYSSDEEVFVSLYDLKNEIDGKQQKDVLDVQLAEIKMRIKEKKLYLAELKQAAAYKKLHNVEELKQLIRLWKKGCHSGLRHLLVKLKEHGEIDMLSLIKNLNILNVVSYDTNTDSFI